MQLFFWLSLLCCAGLSSCTVDKDFSMPLEVEFFVNGSTSAVVLADTLDASSESSDYAKYKDDVKGVDLESATFTLSDITASPSAVITFATLEVSDMTGTVTKKIAEVSNINLQASNNVELPLTLLSEGKDYFKSLMSGDGKAVLRLTATSNEDGVSFNSLFKFKTKVTFEKTIP